MYLYACFKGSAISQSKTSYLIDTPEICKNVLSEKATWAPPITDILAFGQRNMKSGL
jgi:hypothetical protein